MTQNHPFRRFGLEKGDPDRKGTHGQGPTNNAKGLSAGTQKGTWNERGPIDKGHLSIVGKEM